MVDRELDAVQRVSLELAGHVPTPAAERLIAKVQEFSRHHATPGVAVVDEVSDPPVEAALDAAAKARRYRESLEQEGPGGPAGVGFVARTPDGQSTAAPSRWQVGELVFALNPLTGDVRVTSLSGYLQLSPVTPGVADLTGKRRANRNAVGG